MGTFNAATMQDLRNLSAKGPTLEEVAAANVPLHFLCGARDAVLGPRRSSGHMRSCGLDTHHRPERPALAVLELPDVFNATVHGLLQRIYGLEP